jgi:signal transduction histidine kinase
MCAIHDFRHPPSTRARPYNDRVKPDTWLTAAGFVTWVASGVPAALAIADGRMSVARAAAWVVAYAAFGIAFGLACAGRRRWLRLLLAVQAAAGLAIVAAARDGLGGVTLVVVAAQLIGPFPPRVAAAWVAVQTAVLVVIFGRIAGASTALTLGSAFLGFQIFALATAALATRERAAREELALANAELMATRSLLAENSRVAERLRISRDLHDTLGHHLTALSLQLEVASRLTSGAAAERVDEAHAITRLLLGDVRDVVSRFRDTSRFNIAEAVRALTESAATLEIHVQVPDGLDVGDPLQAHAILRCVQEIITNTARHAAAAHLWIAIERQPGGIALTARDDGRGADIVAWGNGLRGMRERFEELSGRVEFSSAAGRGFEVHAFMPGEYAERRGPFGSAAETTT